MLRVRKHIYRLDSLHLVLFGEQLKVASLCCRVATHINDTLGVGKEDGVDDILMHAGTRRVGYDDVGLAVLLDEVSIEDVLHVTSEELSVLDAIYLGIHFGILDGLRHILDADDLTCSACHEVSDGAGARIEVVNEWTLSTLPHKGESLKRQLARYLI